MKRCLSCTIIDTDKEYTDKIHNSLKLVFPKPNSDFWIRYDGHMWCEMTVEEQLEYD